MSLSFLLVACGVEDPASDEIGSISQAAGSDDLLMTFEGTEVGVPARDMGSTSFDVDWDNDGTFDLFARTGAASHTFATAGPHTIRVQGQIDRISFRGVPYAENLVSIDQWGSSSWKSMIEAFYGCSNLVTLGSDAPDLTEVTSMAWMFSFATKVNDDINDWQVDNVEDMTFMFRDAFAFNGDISGWSVGSVTTMSAMFNNANSFNQNLGQWDISSVQDLGSIFNATGISQANYDATITGWASLPSVQPNLDVGANGLTYCASIPARTQLSNDYDWEFFGDSRNCCGNGTLEAGEVCDDGTNDGSGGSCRSDCTAFANNCYPDSDDDGFGSASASPTVQFGSTSTSCNIGYTVDRTDCDDIRNLNGCGIEGQLCPDPQLPPEDCDGDCPPVIIIPGTCGADCYPGNTAPDICDGFNQDCDGQVDEDFSPGTSTCGQGACAATGTEVCDEGEVVDACSPGTPAANDASCDGVDNDCDGEIDEDYVPMATSCGAGACAAVGATSCDEGTVLDSCNPGQPAGSDATCDGVDDDCDSSFDEDYVGTPTSCGAGACATTGSTICSNGDVQDTCSPGTPAANDATCDGVDDDCDGFFDEDYSSVSTSCGTGACADTGATSCVSGTVQDSCSPGSPAANDATCDGIDDDCDSEFDEDYANSTTSCGTGACAANGTLTCVEGRESDSCNPGTPAASDATCDGVDDDCDGEADQDYVETSTTCGQGACGGSGTLSCEGGAEQDSCSEGSGAPTDASCDGVDNDCSGEADEDYVPSTTTCGVGACESTGTSSCTAGTESDSCTPGSPAANDANCNGIDDDCDGEIDEDYVETATSCGTGACAATGTLSCVEGAEVDSCTSPSGSATDATCDGVDDDCDGQVDEDYASSTTSCGAGACAADGVLSCREGVEVDSCTAGSPAASDATCDGVDDDCDGSFDEDYAQTATTCGQGACGATGQLTCEDGSEVDSCSAGTPAPNDATCDGVDDDCDGQDDEDYASTPTSCGVGACGDSGVLRCVAGDETDSCEPGTPAADDATCDGIDDDCDGEADEDYAETSSSCGLGECTNSGTVTCVAGLERDSCAPGVAAGSDAVCDGLDEDCDGDIDEDATGCFACDDVSDCPTLENTCQQYQCVSNVCEIGDVDDGVTCNDGLFCTTTDRCDGDGTCVGSGQPCDLGEEACDEDGDFCDGCLVDTDCADDNNECTDEACAISASSANACESTPTDAGTSCTDDGLFCTGEETCDGEGACVSDGDPCTNGVGCNEVADSCALPCGDGIVDGAEVCDDGEDNGTVGSCSEVCDGYVVSCFVDTDEDGFGGTTSVTVTAPAVDTSCDELTGESGETLVGNGDDCDDTEALCAEDCSDVDNDGTPDCADSCIDADRDGFGIGEGCTGVDCDDEDPSCFTDCSVRAPGFGCIDEQICKRELPGADSDNDGLPDFYEELLCVDVNNALTDSDALNDFIELCDFGTNPCANDTDDDGFDDGVEIEAGSDPLDPDSVPELGLLVPDGAHGGGGAEGCTASGLGSASRLPGGLLLLIGLMVVRLRRRGTT